MGQITKIINPDISEMAGKIYFSKKQWRYLRDQNRMRTFAMNNQSRIIEYTEMHTFKDLSDNPGLTPIFDDAEDRGIAMFHHHEDLMGRIICRQ